MGITLSATIDDNGLGIALALAPDKTRKEAEKAVRTRSLQAERMIKDDMPVDTGRARASWGHYSPGDLKAAADGGAGDSVWEETNGGLTITQGSNLTYIEALNNGSSQQQGPGFVDGAAQTAAFYLIDDVTEIAGRVL